MKNALVDVSDWIYQFAIDKSDMTTGYLFLSPSIDGYHNRSMLFIKDRKILIKKNEIE
jgi:hypothetical protein